MKYLTNLIELDGDLFCASHSEKADFDSLPENLKSRPAYFPGLRVAANNPRHRPKHWIIFRGERNAVVIIVPGASPMSNRIAALSSQLVAKLVALGVNLSPTKGHADLTEWLHATLSAAA